MEEIELGVTTPPATAGHDVDLEFAVKQDGAPFLESKTSYHHCSAAVVSFIVGNIVAMAGPLGPKGKKGKGGEFQVDMKVSVDGAQSASGSWDGLTREGSLAFERNLLETWLHMNHNGALQAKAYGKIRVRDGAADLARGAGVHPGVVHRHLRRGRLRAVGGVAVRPSRLAGAHLCCD